MKLIYVYIDGWCDLGAKHLNLDSGYKCSMKDAVLTVKQQKPLPDNFFVLDANSPVVESVSALIGDNGSGKSSTARCLANIILRDKNMPLEFIVLVEHKGVLKCFCRHNNFDLKCKQNISVYDCRSRHWLSDLLNFVYITPNYTPGNHLGVEPREQMQFVIGHRDIPRVMDLSASALFFEWRLRAATSKKYLHEISDIDRDPVESCERIIVQRIMQFCLANDHSENEGLYGDIPYPDSILVGPDETSIINARMAFDGILTEPGLSDDTKSTLRRVKELVDCDLRDDFFMRCMQCYIAGVWVEADVYDKTEEPGLRFYQRELIAVGAACINEWKRGGKHRRNARVRFVEFLSSGCVPLISVDRYNINKKPLVTLLFKELLALSDKARKFDPLTIECSASRGDAKLYARALRLVQLHFWVRDGGEFLRFSYRPHLCAGATSFLFMWAQLFDFLGRYAPPGHLAHTTETGSVVVFFDEAELSLHPDKQRRFVEDAIRFFERMAHGVKYHLIIATHSPLILSDIPSGNVSAMDGSSLPETFASNIFDLYRLHFVMKNGTIGAFAARKLNAVLNKLNGNAMCGISDDDRRTIDLIGDARLKRYFCDRVQS